MYFFSVYLKLERGVSRILTGSKYTYTYTVKPAKVNNVVCKLHFISLLLFKNYYFVCRVMLASEMIGCKKRVQYLSIKGRDSSSENQPVKYVLEASAGHKGNSV